MSPLPVSMKMIRSKAAEKSGNTVFPIMNLWGSFRHSRACEWQGNPSGKEETESCLVRNERQTMGTVRRGFARNSSNLSTRRIGEKIVCYVYHCIRRRERTIWYEKSKVKGTQPIKPQLHIHDFGHGRATIHPDLSNRDASA